VNLYEVTLNEEGANERDDLRPFDEDIAHLHAQHSKTAGVLRACSEALLRGLGDSCAS
jgi:hypothetical protein